MSVEVESRATLKRTKLAVDAWDSTFETRMNMYVGAETPRDVYRAQAFERLLANYVREAFAEDTKDVNSRERAFLIHPDDTQFRIMVDPRMRAVFALEQTIEALKRASHDDAKAYQAAYLTLNGAIGLVLNSKMSIEDGIKLANDLYPEVVPWTR
jgi:hypothetical protein